MKVFQELKILDKGKFNDLVIKKNNLSSEWKRNLEREKSFEKDTSDIAYCFDYLGEALNKAKLWVMEKGSYYTVTSIVPQEKNRLDEDEYNALLSEFITKNLKGFDCKISESDVTLIDLAGEALSKKFYSFSRLANKSTGRTHPCDEKRWFDFVLSCLKKNEYIIPEYISFFLIEDGWDEQSAFDLSLDYEYTYQVMKYTRENK